MSQVSLDGNFCNADETIFMNSRKRTEFLTEIERLVAPLLHYVASQESGVNLRKDPALKNYGCKNDNRF